MSDTPDIKDFEALGLQIGTIVRCEDSVGARDPAYRLWIDLGGDGVVQSSAKLTQRYGVADLVGRQVVVVTGCAPMRVAGFRSDVLVLGALGSDGVVLLAPDDPVEPGSRVA